MQRHTYKLCFRKDVAVLKGNFGNPSSIYYLGRESKSCRRCSGKSSKAISANQEKYFTGSGTEADN